MAHDMSYVYSKTGVWFFYLSFRELTFCRSFFLRSVELAKHLLLSVRVQVKYYVNSYYYSNKLQISVCPNGTINDDKGFYCMVVHKGFNVITNNIMSNSKILFNTNPDMTTAML